MYIYSLIRRIFTLQIPKLILRRLPPRTLNHALVAPEPDRKLPRQIVAVPGPARRVLRRVADGEALEVVPQPTAEARDVGDVVCVDGHAVDEAGGAVFDFAVCECGGEGEGGGREGEEGGWFHFGEK